MAINQVKLKISSDVPVSRLANDIEIGDEKSPHNLGIENVQILFNDHFHVEVKQKSPTEVSVIITSGGVSRELDLATFQHLITMNY